MATKIVKVARKVGPTDIQHIDLIVANMIEQARDRAVQEGGVITPHTTVKVVVEQEFISNGD